MFSSRLLGYSSRNSLSSRNFTISSFLRNNFNKDTTTQEYRDITKDRTQIIPVETSIKYLKSPAYQQTYGSDPVWKIYRRNHKGSRLPTETRKTCIRAGVIATGNPCPICRDEYLVLSEYNIELLKQFVCPHTGEILSFSKTGLCQEKHTKLLVAIKRAYNFGLLTFDVPFRAYNYSDYYNISVN